jgi:hypothetical protein
LRWRLSRLHGSICTKTKPENDCNENNHSETLGEANGPLESGCRALWFEKSRAFARVFILGVRPTASPFIIVFACFVLLAVHSAPAVPG